MLTVSTLGTPPARPPGRGRRASESAPPLVRGAVAVAQLTSLALAAPRVALTGRYRGSRVHPLAYVAALAAVLAVCAAVWGGASAALLTACDTALPAPLADALCGRGRVLLADEREGIRVVDRGGVRSLYLDGVLQTRVSADGQPLTGYERHVVNAALDAIDGARGGGRGGGDAPATATAVALLGLGGGGLAANLRKHCGSDCGRIVAVEHSADVISVARQHFALDAHPLAYVHADARAYLAGQPEAAFDLIINDALTGGAGLRRREREAAEAAGTPIAAALLAHPPFVALAHAKLRRGGAYIVVVACPGVGPLAQPLHDARRRLQAQFRSVTVVKAPAAGVGAAWGVGTRHHVLIAYK